MEDAIDFARGQGFHERRIWQRADERLDARVAEIRQRGVERENRLDRRLARREAPVRQQAPHQGRADETAGSGDRNAQRVLLQAAARGLRKRTRRAKLVERPNKELRAACQLLMRAKAEEADDICAQGTPRGQDRHRQRRRLGHRRRLRDRDRARGRAGRRRGRQFGGGRSDGGRSGEDRRRGDCASGRPHTAGRGRGADGGDRRASRGPRHPRQCRRSRRIPLDRGDGLRSALAANADRGTRHRLLIVQGGLAVAHPPRRRRHR